METYTFWRDREKRFRELALVHGAVSLHATPVTSINLQSLLAESYERVRAASTTPRAQGSVMHAGTAARVGRHPLDDTEGDRWVVSGGPADEQLRASLQKAFRAEAMMAAVGADEADARATDQSALEAWLDLVARENPRLLRYGGVIEQLADLSAETCNQLASRAYRESRAHSVMRSPAEKAPPPTAFQARSTWLKSHMATKHLTPHRIGVLGGFDKATVQRILRGERVRPVSLDKLAAALGVSRSDIPDD